MSFVPRPYQEKIVRSIATNGNTLVVLPTGLGKTIIAFELFRLLFDWIDAHERAKLLFLAPTKPLAQQHMASFCKFFPEKQAVSTVVCGEIPQGKRAIAYDHANFIFGTPQTVANDLEHGVLDPNDVSVCVIDEAHRAVGNYAYVKVVEHLPEEALIVGLTASPGGVKEKIEEVLNNLRIKNVELLTSSDPLVKPYVQDVSVNWCFTTLSGQLAQARAILVKMAHELAISLRNMGFRVPLRSKKDFLQYRNKIVNVDGNIRFPALLTYYLLLHVQHMTELLETQGAYSVLEYLAQLKEKESKTARIIVKKPEIKKVEQLLNAAKHDHPKLDLLLSLLKKLRGKKAIVFTQYRSQVKKIYQTLQEAGISCEMFMGKKKGYGKKKQEEVLERFRNDEFDVLISSSIGEEGLDIPGVDVVIFYEPVPSEIRTIQRRGRAGRFDKGEIYVLITKKTRDEIFFWSAKKKERLMKKMMIDLMSKGGGESDVPDVCKHMKSAMDQKQQKETKTKVVSENDQLKITDYLT